MVTAIVAAETLLLVLLLLLVVAVLRSHAEILRRLETLDPAAPVPRPEAATGSRAAPALTGATPSGGAQQVASSGELLLAFLSSGCSSCTQLIDTVADARARLPRPVRLVVVTKSVDVERVRRFRPLEQYVPVVMSSTAWDDYAVPGSPYFVHVVDGVVAGEGSGTTWEQVTGLLLDAVAERDNAARVDAELALAGIDADHPSLRPGREAHG
ncbi:MAG TPA: hypothetical protein VI408_01300 [Gaiellaceae bacterium]